MKQAVDRALAKVVSRKLLAWVVATVSLAAGAVDPDAWVAITCVYVGTQGVQDIASAVLGARGGDREPR